MFAYTVYQKAFYAHTKNCSVLLKVEFDMNGTNSLRRGKVNNETERSRITLNGTNFA